jgi:DNA-binding transcriptional LysR family regulator
MRELSRLTGSIHNLVLFEAAGRLASFSQAAEELGVTQPAVSQGVRRLEAAIGARLFHRQHRSIALTDAGERLYSDVSASFTRILSTARQIGRAARSDHVTVMASTAFATWWMVPRLADFRARHPLVDLRLETLDKDLDISSEATSLAVRRGDGRWPGYAQALIARECLVPVASPAYLARRKAPRSVDGLRNCPLIHLDEPHRYRPGWPEYFRHAGVDFRDQGEGLRLNDYALVLQAAMAGEGVAIGWAHICERPIAQGLLVPVGPWRWETGAGFHLVWSQTQTISAHAALVRDWIVGVADAPSTPSHDQKTHATAP